MTQQVVALLPALLVGGVGVSADEIAVTYPHPYALCQRDSPARGEIPIRGTYAGELTKVEARFRGGPWRVVDARPQGGVFAGRLRAGVGQGDLEVRAAGTPDRTVVVKCVAVGDLFLIAGQSNADGRGTAHIRMDPASPYVGVKYRRGAWSTADDPSANDTDDGSPWPVVLNALIPDLKVPMGFIAAAVGSTVVKQWRRGGDLYTRAMAMVKDATGGTMRLKAVLYYQGENDITHWNQLSVLGDYPQYKANLMAAVSDFHDDLNAPVLVGQITNLGSEVARNDNVRRAQQEVWAENPNALPGAVAYDILPTDGVHYRDEANLRAFARRWTMAILSSLYARKGCAGPKLRRIQRIDGTTLKLLYDRPLTIETWRGEPAEKGTGFRVADGERVLTDTNVASTRVDGREVTLRLDQSVSAQVRLSYGSGAAGQGGPVLRDAATKLPVPMMWDAEVETGE